MAPASTNTGIPKDSWVLVTGVNGYVASHTADQLLQQGYRVRGTVRDPSKSRWIEHLFHEKYGADRFELVRVDDMTAPGAFDQAVKGKSFHSCESGITARQFRSTRLIDNDRDVWRCPRRNHPGPHTGLNHGCYQYESKPPY